MPVLDTGTMTQTVDLGSPYLVATIVDRVLHVRIDRVDRRNAMTQDMYRGVKRAGSRWRHARHYRFFGTMQRGCSR